MGNNIERWTEYPLRDIPQGVLEAAYEVLHVVAVGYAIDPTAMREIAELVIKNISKWGYEFNEREEF